jgi:hypothetical protein
MPRPTYSSTEAPSYSDMNSDMNKFQIINTNYATQLDNIINNQPLNLPIVPTINPSENYSQNYDFLAAVDTSLKDDSKTTLDVSNDDTYDLIIQQNTMYILGSLACASLLIASIFIGKR